MRTPEKKGPGLTLMRTIPWWVWLLALSLTLVQPIARLWILYFPPDGIAVTGLRTYDCAIYLACMRMFESGFESPWAMCSAEAGTHSIIYFAVPFFWMYGVFGAAGRLFQLDDFVALGIANAVGAFLYLIGVYAFMRTVAVKLANKAFVLFCLGGGLGGLLFWITWAAGFHEATDFHDAFLRYVQLEMIEGSGRPFPLPLTPRLYYTFPLALCYAALALAIAAVKGRPRATTAIAAPLLFLGVFLNARLGPMFQAVFCLYLLEQHRLPLRHKGAWAAAFALPVGAAMLAATVMLRLNPAMEYDAMTQSLWLSPLISLVFWHLLVAPAQMARHLRQLSSTGTVLATFLLAYLACFVLIWAGWHVYYGTYLHCGDFHAGLYASDRALLLSIPVSALGVYYVRRKRPPVPSPIKGDEPPLAWLSLWFLLFLAPALSAFGGGRFLLVTPERLAVLLGVPLCLISAQAVNRLGASRPRLSALWWATVISCGVCSLAAAVLYFHGPLGYRRGLDPFSNNHFEFFGASDSHCVEALGRGRVLAPGMHGDRLVYRGNPTVLGTGSNSLASHSVEEARVAVERFFAPSSSAADRLSIIRQWCVEWVFIPQESGVVAETTEQLEAVPWLEPVCRNGEAAVFKVVLTEDTADSR